MKASELRAMDDGQLKEQLQNCYQELFNMRFQKATGALANAMRPRAVRREIAQIKTILRERELAQTKA